MPHYHSFEWEGFKVKAEAIGIRRVFKFLPYITGNKPSFKVTIDSKSGGNRQLEADFSIVDPNDMWMDATETVLSTKKEPVKNISKKIELLPIGVSGDHTCKIDLSLEGKEYSRYLVTFRAIAQETMLGWVIATVLGISVLVVAIWNLV